MHQLTASPRLTVATLAVDVRTRRGDEVAGTSSPPCVNRMIQEQLVVLICSMLFGVDTVDTEHVLTRSSGIDPDATR